ncbi:MAG: ribosome maturation factor RimM [Gammaproteobacteria bacterium]|nr:ribosome maturation factor RimM [Gammaproteobacteria bacterium]
MTGPGTRVPLGRVGGPYGVRGWVRVVSGTEPPEGILEYSPWLIGIGGEWRPYEVRSGRPHGKGLVVHLAGCEDRDQAASLAGAEIAVPRSALAELGDDEYYWADLVGLSVVTHEGEELGVVDHLIETGANDVLVVRGDRERLIPFTPGHAVLDVDLERKRLTVVWDPAF